MKLFNSETCLLRSHQEEESFAKYSFRPKGQTNYPAQNLSIDTDN